MDNRKYNIFFHLHTVSGIVISVGLYVIFFAGAFTLFYEGIRDWEKKTDGTPTIEVHGSKKVDFNRAIRALQKKGYDLYGRDVSFYPGGDQNVYVELSGTSDTAASKEAKEEKELTLNTRDYSIKDRVGGDDFSLSGLFYDLHFYYQLGDFGYYLSGLVALFFMFAMVTGVLVHWKKIISNFYIFRPKEKLKTLWTDAHTALGTIGIPFQFMYALTGMMFGLSILIGLSSSVLYKGDQDKVYDEIYGSHAHSIGKPTDVSSINLNAFVDSATHRWHTFETDYYNLTNYGSTEMQFHIYGEVKGNKTFLSNGEVVYNVFNGEVLHEHNPFDKTYSESLRILKMLHFAYYGDIGKLENYLLKAVYFLLALATCFVIISGIMIWLEARNKKNMDAKKRRFNERVGYIYLSFCLSMFPVSALSFIVSKLIPQSMASQRELILNSVFFGGWLIASILLCLSKNNYFINKCTLLVTGILGLSIPLISGIYSQNWLWATFSRGSYSIFVFDLLWLIMAITCIYSVSKLKRPKDRKEISRVL